MTNSTTCETKGVVDMQDSAYIEQIHRELAAGMGMSLEECRSFKNKAFAQMIAQRNEINDMADSLEERRDMLDDTYDDSAPPCEQLDELEFLAKKVGRIDAYNAVAEEAYSLEDSADYDSMSDEDYEDHQLAEEKLNYKIKQIKQAFNMQLLRINKQKHFVKMFVACVAVHNIAMHRHARARSYRAPTRNATNSNAAHDDGGGGDDGGGSDSEPARPYHPHVIPQKFQQNSNSVAVDNPRLLLRGLRKEAAA